MPPLAHTSYMICATQRPDSNLLCEALADTGVAGHPTEYFLPENQDTLCQRWGVSTEVEFVDKVIERGSSPNGVFGVKVMMGDGYFDHVIDTLSRSRQLGSEDLPAPQLVRATFPNLHHIWMTRRNKVRQAVSWWKAIQTDVWGRSRGEHAVARKEPVFDFDAIDSLVQAVALKETSWQEYFADSDSVPLVVVYEDFLQAYEETVIGILEYLDVPVPQHLPQGAMRLQRQADKLSDEWVAKYRKINQSGSKGIQWEYVSGEGLIHQKTEPSIQK